MIQFQYISQQKKGMEREYGQINLWNIIYSECYTQRMTCWLCKPSKLATSMALVSWGEQWR